MSTILKALKKAEGSGHKKAPFVRASLSEDKNRWLLIPVALCVLALGYFFAAYIFNDSSTTAVMPHDAKVPVSKTATSPPSAQTLNDEAVVHIRAGRLKEAEDLLREALIKHPDDAVLHNHLGLALKKQGRPIEAASEYERALQLKTDYHVAMNNMAVALEATGDVERAAEYYEKALAGDPSMSGAHLNYALLLEKQGKLGEAENHYHTFLTMSKDEGLKGLVRRRLQAIK